MSVLVAGCGWLGHALAESLVASGERVIAMRRSWAGDAPRGAIAVACDLGDARGLAALPRDVDRLVLAASPGGGTAEAYRGVYVEGLTNLLDALPVRRAIVTTSTAVYAQDDGSVVDETSETTARGTAAVLLESERLVRERCAEGISLRLSGLYGPGRDRMIRAVRDGTARRPGEARITNRIHRDDAASAIAHLLRIDRPETVYVATDDEPADLGEVYAWLARELGMEPPPIGDDERAGRGGSKRCSNARLRASGWAARYPSFRDGYRQMIVAP